MRWNWELILVLSSGLSYTGYTGTIASTWQRGFRLAGRSTRRIAYRLWSLIPGPINQFMVQNPDYFMEKSGICPNQPQQLVHLVSHIKCAVFELPFRYRRDVPVISTIDILEYLTEEMSAPRGRRPLVLDE